METQIIPGIYYLSAVISILLALYYFMTTPKNNRVKYISIRLFLAGLIFGSVAALLSLFNNAISLTPLSVAIQLIIALSLITKHYKNTWN